MSRSAICVDAGYVLAEGPKVTIGKESRARLVFRHGKALEDLAAVTTGATQLGGGSHLRTYWYDAAKNRQPTSEQEAISQVPFVSLRLGNLNSTGQKGVDALIYRDLMSLARERAVDRIYLFSGDEDLLEGVRDAQDMGVSVVLVAIAQGDGSLPTVARSLRREVDDVLRIAPGLLGTWFASLSTFVSEQGLPTVVHQGVPQTDQTIAMRLGCSWAWTLTERQLSELQQFGVLPDYVDDWFARRMRSLVGGNLDIAALRQHFRAGLDHDRQRRMGQAQYPSMLR